MLILKSLESGYNTVCLVFLQTTL